MLRDAYLAWTRRAVPLLAAPLVLTALIQSLARSDAWGAGPDAPLGVRSLFIAVAVASVAFGRAARVKETRDRPLTVPRLVSLSWRLVVMALLPSAIGGVLAWMTQSTLDYYLLLLVTLVGVALLYPRYDQWVAWAAPDGGEG